MFFKETLRDGITILKKVFEKGSYSMFMAMRPLAALLFFQHLELSKLYMQGYAAACAPESAAAGAGKDCSALLGGFGLFVSSGGRAFGVSAGDVPSPKAMPAIVQGLRCLEHLGQREWEMLGEVTTAGEMMLEGRHGQEVESKLDEAAAGAHSRAEDPIMGRATSPPETAIQLKEMEEQH